jgi:hypothetical protein
MAIHFEDLNADVQKQIIKDALRSLVHEHFIVRRLYIEPLRPDLPEQCIHAYIDVINEGSMDVTKQLYALLWDVRDSKITRTLKETKEDTSYKEQLTLKGITADYPPLVERNEGMDAVILLTVETEKARFGVKLEVVVQESISEEDKYELARKFMAQAIFQMQSIDRRYKNGCALDGAIKAIGERMPDVVQAISERKEYRYIINNETKGE